MEMNCVLTLPGFWRFFGKIGRFGASTWQIGIILARQADGSAGQRYIRLWTVTVNKR
jgi:hypothetical protein